MNLFLTGPIQVGKSTIIDRLLKELALTPSGFRTHRCYVAGRQTGFIMEDLTKTIPCDQQPLYIARPGAQGCWEADTGTFDTFGVKILEASLANPGDLILMDELGHLESAALSFQEQVRQCLAAPVPVLGVLKQRSTPFLDSLRRRADVALITVTQENRDEAYPKATALLTEILKGP